MIDIRRLKPDDAEAYRLLRQHAVRTTPRTFLMTPEMEEAKPQESYVENLTKNYFAGAFHENVLVGMLGLFRKPQPFEYIGSLGSLYVSPEFRGQKVAVRMMEHIESYARQIGLRQLRLAVVVGNASACRLYDSLGYKVYGIEPDALCLNGEYLDEELRFKKL